MTSRYLPASLILLALILLLAWTGCSATSAVVHKMIPEEATGLKKKILLLPFLDQAGLGEEQIGAITAEFLSYITKDDRIVIQRAVGPLPTTSRFRSPEFGIVIDPDQAKRAEEMGMHTLVTVVINPFEVNAKTWGIWPLRKVKKELEVSMVVNALDVTSGTLFLSHLADRKVKLRPLEVFESEEEGPQSRKPDETFTQEEINQKKYKKAWSEIIEEGASALRKALREQPWSGRIVSVSPETIIINAGRDTGNAAGTLFEVFGRGESIRSAGGTTLHLLGAKVGEIETIQVMNGHATAAPREGGAFSPGLVIRTKTR